MWTTIDCNDPEDSVYLRTEHLPRGLLIRNRGLRPTADSTRVDTVRSTNYNPFRPNFRLNDRYGDPFSNFTTYSPLYLKDPKSLKTDVEVDTGRNYNIYEKMGTVNFRLLIDVLWRVQSPTRPDHKAKLLAIAQQSLGRESAVSSRNLIQNLCKPYPRPDFWWKLCGVDSAGFSRSILILAANGSESRIRPSH